MTPTNAQRLWDLTAARAAELGVELQDLANEAGVSQNTLHRWRRGEMRINEKNDLRIHTAFGWQPGSRDAILSGEDPAPVAERPEPTPESTDEGDWRIPAVRALLAGLPRSRKERVTREALEEPETRRRSS